MTDEDCYELHEKVLEYVNYPEFGASERRTLKLELDKYNINEDVRRMLFYLIPGIKTMVQRQMIDDVKAFADQVLDKSLLALVKSGPVNIGQLVDARGSSGSSAMHQVVQAQEAYLKAQGNKNEGNISIGGSVQGSAVGHAAKFNARDIGSFAQAVEQSGVDDDLKAALKQALDHLQTLDIAQGDKDDVSDDISKLSAELDKPEKDVSRIAKILKRIEEAAPSVAAILTSVAGLAKLVGLG